MRYSGFLIKYCCGQVVFLLLFVAYFVIGVVALAVDAEAMDAACATDSWIWCGASLYTLLHYVLCLGGFSFVSTRHSCYQTCCAFSARHEFSLLACTRGACVDLTADACLSSLEFE